MIRRAFLAAGLCVTLAAAAAAPASLAAQADTQSAPKGARADSTRVDPEMDRAIRRLLEVSGTVKATEQSLAQSIAMFQQMAPGAPSSFWDEMRKDMPIKELIDAIVPIYARHFTLAQLNDILAFYESPSGRHLAEEQPMLVAEGMRAGQQIGLEWGQRVAERLTQKGYMKRGS